MKEYVYLDSAAKTFPFYHRCYDGIWWNSNSPYAKNENDTLETARNEIKKCLNVKGGKILFFRCATDIVEWLSRIANIDCEFYEHDSVFNVRNSDKILEESMYVCQLVNQMTGVIFDTKEIKNEVNYDFTSNGCRPYTFFGIDATAAIGHINIPLNIESYCDAFWFDGIKFHTEGNMAVLWINDKLANYLHATESNRNQYGLLHGTMDVEGTIMIAEALKNACENIIEKTETWEMLTDIIIRDLHEADIECSYVSNNNPRTHAINAIEFEKINGDALATFLADKNIFVGKAGSACSEENDYRVLNAFKLSNEEASRVIRVSFDENTTIHDIKKFVEGVIDFYKNFC